MKQNGRNIVFQDQNMVVCAIFLGYSVSRLGHGIFVPVNFGDAIWRRWPFVFWDWSRIQNLFNVYEGANANLHFPLSQGEGFSFKRCLNHVFFSSDAAVSYMVYTSDNEEHPCKRHVQQVTYWTLEIDSSMDTNMVSSSTPEKLTWK